MPLTTSGTQPPIRVSSASHNPPKPSSSHHHSLCSLTHAPPPPPPLGTGEPLHVAKAAEGRNEAQDDPVVHAVHAALRPQPAEKAEGVVNHFPETLDDAIKGGCCCARCTLTGWAQLGALRLGACMCWSLSLVPCVSAAWDGAQAAGAWRKAPTETLGGPSWVRCWTCLCADVRAGWKGVATQSS